jgi:hypothetical protein
MPKNKNRGSTKLSIPINLDVNFAREPSPAGKAHFRGHLLPANTDLLPAKGFA